MPYLCTHLGANEIPGSTVEALSNVLGWKIAPYAYGGYFNVGFGYNCGRCSLNARYFANKQYQLNALEKHNIAHPKIQPNRGIDGFDYPVMGRNSSHRRGLDILWLPSREEAVKKLHVLKKKEFFTKFIDSDREFRVHVLGARWRSISEKVIDEKTFNRLTERQRVVRAARFGWKHKPVGSDDPIRPIVGSLGVKAARAMQFDFCAVDILLGKDGKLYVLEGNAAPSLNPRRVEMYAEYFLAEYAKWMETNRERN